MQSKAKFFKTSYFSPDTRESLIRTIHSYVEHALMRVYAQRKINIKYQDENTANAWNLQGEIERALSTVTTTDIEKIWRVGANVIDDTITKLLEQLPTISHSKKIVCDRNIFLQTNPVEFSLLLVSKLLEQVETNSIHHTYPKKTM